MTPITDEDIQAAAEAYLTKGSIRAAMPILGLSYGATQMRVKRAAERGLLGTQPVLPGYAIKSIASKAEDGSWIKQTREPGEPFQLPDGHAVKGVSALVDADGRVIQQWVKTNERAEAQRLAIAAAVEGFKDELPRAEPVPAPIGTLEHLLCQYTITDMHLGALAWNEETRGGDYDLSIGEQLIIDWFAAAIRQAPDAKRAVFAQLGDFLHYDSFKSITSEHGHLLDSDTRYPKMVRAAIRIVRTIIRMLLAKHEEVTLIMCDANHDPSSEVWLREAFAAFLEDEPRLKVDTTPGTYTPLEHGKVSLFYHHGHKRNTGNIDTVFAGKFREIYGRTKFSYAHTGHKHCDDLKTTNLMKVEQHETLAAPDAYAANGGWLSGRSAKVIIYHAEYGEVGRFTLTPEMVLGASRVPVAANDNEPGRMVA